MPQLAKDAHRSKPKWWWNALVVVVAFAGWLALKRGWIETPKTSPTAGGASTAPRVEPTRSSNDDSATLDALVRAKRSNVVVELAGVVVKLLPDDNDGDRHQKFLVQVGDNTVLIAHNLDLAPRLPIRERDAIRFKGEYEYTDRGGVVHWTHRDPARRHAGGWIEVGGSRYE